MINLLPPQEQKELLLRKNKNIAIILGTVVLVALASTVLVLLALKFYVLEAVNYHQNIADSIGRGSQSSELLPLKEVIGRYNGTLTKIDAFYKKEIRMGDALRAILQVPRPQGFSFTRVSLAKTDDDAVNMTIAGISDTRDHLLEYKRSIESGSFPVLQEKGLRLGKIYFPPESWVQPGDISFYFTLEIFHDK